MLMLKGTFFEFMMFTGTKINYSFLHRSYFWHFGQKNEDRPPSLSSFMGLEQRGQFCAFLP